MQRDKLTWRTASNNRIFEYLPVFFFLLIAVILFASNAFPSLFGDEYGSLFDAYHLTGNIHAIGYFSQLHLWNSIYDSDWFLRSLSLLWFGAGLYWLNAWLKDEQTLTETRIFTIWLALLNPFLWVYGFQIRFYAMFFAASILFVWRFRTWEKSPSPRNATILAASGVITLTSHLFGTLVLATIFLHYIWTRFSNKRWIFLGILIFSFTIMLLPPVRSAAIWVVYRMSNPYAEIPDLSERGISLGMLAKIPFTFYFFMLGERVYPLWWWITIPSVLLAGTTLLFGIWRIRRFAGPESLSIFMLFNIPFLFLILDPLAPPDLQGAAPRYLIFVLPYVLYLLAKGAEDWKSLKSTLIIISVVGLYCLAFPVWSYSGSDLVNWQRILTTNVTQPEQTCVITDGRSQALAVRYLPEGTKISFMGNLEDCTGFQKIVFVSNDHRLSMVRYFDDMTANLGKEYNLVSNTTFFPAQVTVYEQNSVESSQPPPSRLDLPEHDLHFPITSPDFDRKIQGFVRLDAERLNITIPLTQENLNDMWILTNYRSRLPSVDGTPVFRLQFNDSNENNREVILRAGIETAAWDGSCNSCRSVYQWTKLVHLLGSYSYPGAYRQYESNIWGFPLANSIYAKEINSVNATFLLPDGTGYFYGIFPQAK
jgi:hypothetical protein